MQRPAYPCRASVSEFHSFGACTPPCLQGIQPRETNMKTFQLHKYATVCQKLNGTCAFILSSKDSSWGWPRHCEGLESSRGCSAKIVLSLVTTGINLWTDSCSVPAKILSLGWDGKSLGSQRRSTLERLRPDAKFSFFIAMAARREMLRKESFEQTFCEALGVPALLNTFTGKSRLQKTPRIKAAGKEERACTVFIFQVWLPGVGVLWHWGHY